jgi:hypothetical protein
MKITGLLVFALASSLAVAQTQFTVQPVLVDGSHTGARSLSQNGYVSGNYGFRSRAFRWHDGQGQGLLGFDPSGETYSTYGHEVNSSGTVVGAASNASATVFHASAWDASYHDLDPTGQNSAVFAVNDNGWMAGAASFGGPNHAALWRNGQEQDLGLLPGTGAINGWARLVNSAGLVIGYDTRYAGEEQFDYGWYWTDATGMVATPFVVSPSQGDLNDLGEVTVGQWIYRMDGTRRTLPGATRLEYLNNVGGVVGLGPSGILSFWQGQTRYDLQSLLDPGSGWNLADVYAINDAGQILATGERNGVGDSILLTPVPEPKALLALSGLVMCMLKRRVQRDKIPRRPARPSRPLWRDELAHSEVC